MECWGSLETGPSGKHLVGTLQDQCTVTFELENLCSNLSKTLNICWSDCASRKNTHAVYTSGNSRHAKIPNIIGSQDSRTGCVACGAPNNCAPRHMSLIVLISKQSNSEPEIYPPQLQVCGTPYENACVLCTKGCRTGVRDLAGVEVNVHGFVGSNKYRRVLLSQSVRLTETPSEESVWTL